MSDKLRVHTLSKELGVASKAIVAKCKNEGVEGVTNHMSMLSAGLAETIREWFSAESHGTAVEEAAPVDLEKVRVKRRTPRKKKGEKKEEKAASAEVAQEAEPLVAGAETEGGPEAATVEVAADATTASLTAAPAEAAPSAAPVAPEEPGVFEPPMEAARVELPPAEPPPGEPKGPEILQPAARAPELKPEPKPIIPAGPQNIPAPAQMKGPKVVGFARPDPVVRPSPRPPGPPARSGETPPPPSRRGAKGKLTPHEELGAKRSRHRTNPRRSGTSVSVVGEQLKEWRDRDLLERQERLQAASGRGIHARRAREKTVGAITSRIAERKTKAQIPEPVVMHELCAATGIGLMQLMPKLTRDHGMGLVSRNTVIPNEVAALVMLDFGVELQIVKPKSELDRLVETFAARERTQLHPRPPVVTMLGHVDHGKTSLLDAIRKTSVAEGEAGGITQHMGAYRVERGNLSVTFLDTPGHEAFTAMRARGANLTDVVVLVVAANDGVMPQTIEAINHAKAAKVTIVIALNKIDLHGIDINKTYARLAELGLAPSEWGGDIDVVKTSATTGQGVNELIEHLATLSDLLDLKADPTVSATGAVIEARMQPGMGPLARILVQEGTLCRGDFIVCGPGYGRVRTMRDDRARVIKKATPGMPVEVAGLDESPNAGDKFYCIDSLQQAKEIASETKQRRRQEALVQLTKPRTLQDLFRQRVTGAIPELNLILRADVQGSIDALTKSLSEIPSEEVKLSFLHTGIGSVTESDVVLAEASGALVIGFNVVVEPGAQRMAESQGVDIRLYRVIYNVIDDIRKALEGLLPTLHTEKVQGKAEVREVFRVTRAGMIAGCMVTEGQVARSHHVRVIRDGQIVIPTEDDVHRQRHRGIGSLRRFKDDVREVRAGMECGIRVDNFDDVKPGDVIEAYEVIETARTL